MGAATHAARASSATDDRNLIQVLPGVWRPHRIEAQTAPSFIFCPAKPSGFPVNGALIGERIQISGERRRAEPENPLGWGNDPALHADLPCAAARAGCLGPAGR